MICRYCKEAADVENHELHELCLNNNSESDTHCDCQHREGPRERWIQPAFSDKSDQLDIGH